MGNRPLGRKMALRPGSRAFFAGAPDGWPDEFDLPELQVAHRLTGRFDYLHLFTVTQVALAEQLARLEPHLAERGQLWVSWPKNRQLGTDLTLREVIRIGYDAGLVESTTLRIDDVWSAIRFTRPKPGKLYANSYGTLPG